MAVSRGGVGWFSARSEDALIAWDGGWKGSSQGLLRCRLLVKDTKGDVDTRGQALLVSQSPER